jgi:predicted dehydrogenase
LVRLAEERDLLLFVAHTFLFNPSVRRLRQYIQDGTAGDLYYLKARRTHLGLVREDVNALWDLAPHDISMFLYLLGEDPVQVQAMGGTFLREGREDVAFVNLAFPSGVVTNLTVGWADANKERFLDIVGSRARIVFNDLDALEPVRIFYKGIGVEREQVNFGEFKYLLRDGEIVSPRIQLEEPLKVLCGEFLDCVRQGKGHESDGRFGLRVVEVLERVEKALLESSRQRRT